MAAGGATGLKPRTRQSNAVHRSSPANWGTLSLPRSPSGRSPMKATCHGTRAREQAQRTRLRGRPPRLVAQRRPQPALLTVPLNQPRQAWGLPLCRLLLVQWRAQRSLAPACSQRRTCCAPWGCCRRGRQRVWGCRSTWQGRERGLRPRGARMRLWPRQCLRQGVEGC